MTREELTHAETYLKHVLAQRPRWSGNRKHRAMVTAQKCVARALATRQFSKDESPKRD